MKKAPFGVPFLILVWTGVKSRICKTVYFVESELWGDP
jgi:hypothetical protein